MNNNLNNDDYNNLKEKVQAGIEFLDKNYPGWHNKIDLEILDIGEPEYCICGQVEMKEKDDHLHMSEELGFYPCNNNWEKLEEIWREEILKIRKYENGIQRLNQ